MYREEPHGKDRAIIVMEERQRQRNSHCVMIRNLDGRELNWMNSWDVLTIWHLIGDYLLNKLLIYFQANSYASWSHFG